MLKVPKQGQKGQSHELKVCWQAKGNGKKQQQRQANDSTGIASFTPVSG